MLRYQCGPARSFLEPESDSLYEERTLSCHWNQTWSPPPPLDDCVWTGCLRPPEPELNTSLVLQWDGQPVDFGQNVSYVCSAEDLFFQEDRELTEFNLTCRQGGVCRKEDGACLCPPGYQGARCEDQCQQGTFGEDCSSSCQCGFPHQLQIKHAGWHCRRKLFVHCILLCPISGWISSHSSNDR